MREARDRLNAVFVPLTFVAVTLVGLVLVSALPGVLPWVALRSAGILNADAIDLLVGLPTGLLAYSFFPPGFENWFQVSSAVILLSLLTAGGLPSRSYLLSFGVGALAGGVVFVLTGPPAVLAGPSMAGHGLVGTCCVYAVRHWRFLGWVARSYACFLIASAVFWLGMAFVSPTETSSAEVAAILATAVLGKIIVPSPAVPPAD